MGWVYNATPEVEASSQYRLILGVCLSLTVLMVITVSLRLFIRAQSGRLAAADWVMAGSMVRRAWNIHVVGTCLPVGATFYGLAIFTIIFDVLIILLPIPLLLSLNIKTAQKAGVVCLFLLGLFTTICSILRLTQIQRVAFGDGNSTMLVLWGTIEFNVGNIVTCAPYLAPLLKGVVRDFRSNSD
ncbi:hypothetical protein PENANT_c011G05933 [Penicillium antarcticum]|uniref:Rhodopsin domain-containing protein n=1 Tax=Penicillium antarcticum TaxID=416450 RepID=A0A1V6Q7C2_9EURO|nr:hypothetical protein PENANT_c011G05933 [Penicillium antarcticum]